MNIPSICIDNFYSDPDSIRKFALGLNFTEATDGRWPGSRTDELHTIDSNFFNLFSTKLFSIFFDFTVQEAEWSLYTSFQLVPPFVNKAGDIKNQGWVHYDDNMIFAGVIFLTPDIDPSCGTSIYKEKNNLQIVPSTIKNSLKTKETFYKDKKDINFNEALVKNNDMYDETIRYNNIYNRLVIFDGNVPHGANTYFTSSLPRLTQVFFVKELRSNSKTPIQRHKQFL